MEKYPIEYISLDKLDWKWYAPELRPRGQTPEECFNVRKHVVMKECFMNPNWVPRKAKAVAMKQIFDSVKAQGLIHPLIVGNYRDNRYIVIVGNQRLSALKALNELGLLKSDQIPCRVEPDRKCWDTDWPPARKEHPY